ncbi:MAG: hypothetical protein ACE5GW_13850, partial [Planctomycetota bacterium]
EEGGLTREDTEALQELVRFPTTDEHTSINVAMSVGIVLATAFFEHAGSARADSRAPLLGREREFLKERAKKVFGARARSDPARRDIVDSIERVFSRTPLETRDARAWHLLLRALGSEETPADFGL